MPNKPSDKNGSEIFAELVKVTKRLPPVLAYSLAIVIAIVFAVILRAVFPLEIVVLLGVIILAGLVAFVLYSRTPENVDPDNKSKVTLRVVVYKGEDTSFVPGAKVTLALPDPQIAYTGYHGEAVFASIPSKYVGKKFEVNVTEPSYNERSPEECMIEHDSSLYLSLLPRSILPKTTLGVPSAGKLGLLIDLSHQQNKWKSGSIFDLPLKDNNLSSLCMPPTENLQWDIQEIRENAQFIKSNLPNWRGLIFGMPWHYMISEEVRNTIAEWVGQGGHLVLLGYELGERHHLNNFNELSDKLFGIRFNSDIVAPSGWPYPKKKPYGEEIVFDEIDSSRHSILLKGIHKLSFRNICTLTVEPGSTTIIPVGKNQISKETNPSYTNGFTSSGTQDYELAQNGAWFPVIAEAPQGLCGKGRVIAIGTWDFFGVDDCFKNSDNYTFLKNLLTWLLDR